MQGEKDCGAPENGDQNAPLLLEGYITEKEYARQRGVSLRTCQRERALRKAPPPHVVLGKHVYYRIAAAREWLLKNERSFEDRRPSVTRRGR
jgi:hypothetical protein